MTVRSLNLCLVLAASLLALAACDKSAKRATNTAADAGPTATTAAMPMTPSNTVVSPAAPEGGGKVRLKVACADDIQKFCAGDDKPGRCLHQHESELSQACNAARAERRAEREAAKAQ